MPYIKPDKRIKIEYCLEKHNPITALSNAIENEGELNYVITRLCLEYVNRKGERYKTYNSLIGVLECTKQELYRKYIAPYEDKKEKENGEIL